MLIERAGVREAPRLHLGGCQEVVPPPERRRGISPPAVRGTVVERRLRVVSPVVVLHPLLHIITREAYSLFLIGYTASLHRLPCTAVYSRVPSR